MAAASKSDGPDRSDCLAAVVVVESVGDVEVDASGEVRTVTLRARGDAHTLTAHHPHDAIYLRVENDARALEWLRQHPEFTLELRPND